jgi:guanine deaminase
LAKAGELIREFPDVHLHTHLAENPDEVAWVKQLFPKCKNYLDVYTHYGLVGPRSIFAHCIQLDREEFRLLGQKGANIAFCPTSNLFLGSGLFNMAEAENQGVQVGLATDIGAGTSFSLLQTMAEAYKVQQLQHRTLSPLKAFFMATLGSARALGLQDVIGSFQPGKEADFIVLDPGATPLLELRMKGCRDLGERLFTLAMLGDDRAVQATYILGQKAYSRP